jgi:hypothetical protein
MSDPTGPAQRDTEAIPIPTGGPGQVGYGTSQSRIGQPNYPDPNGPGGWPVTAQPATVDASAHWYAQFRKQRRRARVFALSTALLAITAVILAGTSWALFQANELTNQVSNALPGVSGIIGSPQDPSAGPSQAPTPATSGTTADLTELSELVAGLKNPDGSLNAMGVAALAGKLGTLAQDPQQLNALIDQAQAQGMIDSQVAGLLRGVLASRNGAGSEPDQG